MNQPSLFNVQFTVTALDGSQQPAAGYFLYTWLAGTTTPEETYQDEAGTTPNTNPIVLDADGRVPGAGLFLQTDIEYTVELRTALDAVVKTFDNVRAAAGTTGVVTSVNGETGDVELDAADIPYIASGPPDWLTAGTVEEALDQTAARANAPPAASVSLVDAGNYFEADATVEDALQELGEDKIPDQTGNAGKVLGTDGTNLSWTQQRTFWSLAAPAGTAGSPRTVNLTPGTYQIVLESHFGMSVEGVNTVIKQKASVGSIEVETQVQMAKSGGYGGMFACGSGLAVGVLVVATTDDYVMEIEEMVAGVAGFGSRLTLERM